MRDDIDETYYVGHYDGVPGMVWYSDATPVRGDELKLGDWLDSLDHHTARMIYAMWLGSAPAETALGLDGGWTAPDVSFRTVMFGGGDTETLRADVEYDVVDPDSQVAPDGTPLWIYDHNNNPVPLRDYDYATDGPKDGS